ncbi:MAG: hypothetical protein P8J30_07685, partial [Ilumatobacter sp.]|nr:hypothetical protein [Ilumatobacter sp.]
MDVGRSEPTGSAGEPHERWEAQLGAFAGPAGAVVVEAGLAAVVASASVAEAPGGAVSGGHQVSVHWSLVMKPWSLQSPQAIDEVWSGVEGHRQAMTAAGELAERRRAQTLLWMQTMLRDRLLGHFDDDPAFRSAREA